MPALSDDGESTLPDAQAELKIINGEHAWPGSNFSNGVTNYDINASVEIWKFFSRYDINGLMNSSTGMVENTVNEKRFFKVIDLLGRKTEESKNIPLFYLYDNGTVEKKIIIE